MKEGMNPLLKVPGVSSRKIGDAWYEIDFTPEATDFILKGEGQTAPGYAKGGRVEKGMSQVSDDPIGDFLDDYEMEKLRKKIAENEAALIDLTPVPTRVETGSDPMLLDVYPRLKRQMEANPDRYEYGTARLKDEEFIRPMLRNFEPDPTKEGFSKSEEDWLEYKLRPRGQSDFSDRSPPGMELPSGKRRSVNPRDPYYAKGGSVKYKRLTDTFKKMVSLDTPQDMTSGETVADIAAGFVPGVGTVQSARDFERARREGDKLGMGLAGVGMIPVVGGMVKPGKIAAKSLGELVDQYVRKVRKMDELGPATLSVHRVEAPASAEVPGWHISQDLQGILKTGAMTNKGVGNRNMQGWEPAHVGGAYFYSDPRLARAKWEDVAELLMGDHALAAEMPVIRAQLRRGNRLVPDEDVGLSVPWQQSYKEGSFATTRPVLINQIDRIYSADPDITKDIIRDTVMRQRRYAKGGLVEYDPDHIESLAKSFDAEEFASGGAVRIAEGSPAQNFGKGGVVKKVAELLKGLGVSEGKVASKELTTLQDAHTSLGDSIRERTAKMQQQMDEMDFKYNSGQYVFTEGSAKNNRPPLVIKAKRLYGNEPMREPHPVNPLMGKVIKDPATGLTKRTPYEPGYLVRREGPEEDWSEFVIPQSAIKGSVDNFAHGGMVQRAKGGAVNYNQSHIDELAERFHKEM